MSNQMFVEVLAAGIAAGWSPENQAAAKAQLVEMLETMAVGLEAHAGDVRNRQLDRYAGTLYDVASQLTDRSSYILPR